MQVPFHSYKIDTASTARLLNCFAKPLVPGAKGPYILTRDPGITPFAHFGTDRRPGRGLCVLKGMLHALAGQQLLRVYSNGTSAVLGTVPGDRRAWFANNGTQLALSADGVGYVATSIQTPTQPAGVNPIADPDFKVRAPGSVDFLDNYALWIEETTGRFFVSDLLEFSVYDPLDFATAEGAPDDLVTLIVARRLAILIGQESTEIWANTAAGGAGFPLERIPNGFIDVGGGARHGVVKAGDVVAWLANDRTVRALDGASAMRISQPGVERALSRYATVADCEASQYTLDGHTCAVFRFPEAGATWIYDTGSKEWHERESFPGAAWDLSGIVAAYNRVFVQRASTGEVGVLDPRVASEWGNPLRAQWAYQPIYEGGRGVQLHRLDIGLETGVGTESGQGAEPRIQLEISHRGGREGTFRSVGSRSLGAQGKHRTKVHWDALGTGNDTVIRATVPDPVPLTVWSTSAEVEILAA